MKSYAPLLSLLALIPVLAAAPPARGPVQKQDRALLLGLEDDARGIIDTTDRLESFTRVPDEYSRETQMLQLDTLKVEINRIGPAIERLAGTVRGLNETDRATVNRVVIAAVELAHTVNAAILKANVAEDGPAYSPEYRRLIDDCSRESNQLLKALLSGITELK